MKALYLVLSLILAIVPTFLLTKPALEERPTLEAQRQEVKTKLDAAAGKVAQIPQLKQDLQERQTALSELKDSFPNYEEIGLLIRTLQQAATEAGLSIGEITRQAQPSPIPGFTEVQLGLTITGSFPNLYQFLDWAQRQERILNVTAVNSTSGNTHTVTLIGYTRSDTPQKAAAPAATLATGPAASESEPASTPGSSTEPTPEPNSVQFTEVNP